MRQQAFGHQVSWPVELFVVGSEFGLDGVGGQQDGCLRGTVHLVGQDALLHLQEEKLLGDVLDQLLRHVLGKELGPEFELQGVLLLNILVGDLMRKNTGFESRQMSFKGNQCF